jgi:hypothetical protein
VEEPRSRNYSDAHLATFLKEGGRNLEGYSLRRLASGRIIVLYEDARGKALCVIEDDTLCEECKAFLATIGTPILESGHVAD